MVQINSSWAAKSVLTLLACTLVFASASQSNDDCNACHSTSWLFDRIGKNLTDDQLSHTFVKFCTQDYNGANEYVCKHMATGLLPVFRKIAAADFCKQVHACGDPSSTVSAVQDGVTSSTGCSVCKEIMTEIKQALTNQTLVNEIQQKADDYCNMLPSNGDECKEFVNTELTSVINWIQSEAPEVFCQSIGFCSTRSVANSLPNKDDLINLRHFEAKPQVDRSQDQTVLVTSSASPLQASMPTAKCVICDEVATWAIKLLKQNQTQQMIERGLDHICPMLYHQDALKRAHCDHLVAEYTEQLIHLIVEEVHPEAICHLLNFCPGTSSTLRITLKQVVPKSNQLPNTTTTTTTNALNGKQTAGPTCFVCVQLFRYVYKHLNGTETTQELENVMDHGCNFLFDGIDHNKSHLAKCKKMVASNAETLVKLIKSGAGPTLTCMAIGICFTPAQQRLDMQLLPSPTTTTAATTLTTADQLEREKYLCNKIAQHTFSRSRRSELHVWVALGKSCERAFDPSEQSECTVYVQRNQANLKKAVLQAKSPEQVCEMVTSGAQLPSETSPALSTTADQTPVQGESCDLCKIFLGFVYKDLKENKTQAAIIKVLDEACDKYVPVKHRQECHAYVKAYVVELIDVIEKSTNPAEACSMLGYCTSSQGRLGANGLQILSTFQILSPSVFTSGSPTKPTSKLACDECIKLFTPIHTLLANKTCENLLLADAEKICASCPDRDNCVNVLQSHIKIYFDAVDHYSEPQRVCHHLGFCPTSRPDRRLLLNRRVYNRHRSSPFVGIQSDAGRADPSQSMVAKRGGWRKEGCYECQILTSYARDLLLNKTIDQTIVNFAKQEFCDPLTSKLERIACDDFLNHYGVNMIQHFATNTFNTSRVCTQELHVCPDSQQQQLPHSHHDRPLLGSHECTYGPSFWCLSAENARMCKMTEYCERKAWNTRK